MSVAAVFIQFITALRVKVMCHTFTVELFCNAPEAFEAFDKAIKVVIDSVCCLVPGHAVPHIKMSLSVFGNGRF